MIKRDLEVSTNDFLTGLRAMERTLTHQHRKAIDEIEHVVEVAVVEGRARGQANMRAYQAR